MRKPAFLSLLFLLAALSFGQEFVDVDFFRDLTETINHFDLSELSDGSEGMLFLPTVYLSRRFHTYATFGIMFSNPFHHIPEYEHNELPEEDHPTTILKAAFVLRRKKTNVMLYFDYNSDYSWGLSLKLKF